jgi:hypothetical protein
MLANGEEDERSAVEDQINFGQHSTTNRRKRLSLWGSYCRIAGSLAAMFSNSSKQGVGSVTAPSIRAPLHGRVGFGWLTTIEILPDL